MDGWIALVISIPASVILAFLGIYLTNRFTHKEGEKTSIAIINSTASIIKEQRKAGVECIEDDIDALSRETKIGIEAIAKVIQVSGEQTLKAIEKDGAETRQAIEGIHKSIKAELGKGEKP